jgi:hypothetical protein
MLVSDLAYGLTLGLQQASQFVPALFPAAQLFDALFLVVVPPYTVVSGLNAIYDLSLAGAREVSLGELLVWSWRDAEGRPFIGAASSLLVPLLSSAAFGWLLTRHAAPKVKPFPKEGEAGRGFVGHVDVEHADVVNERHKVASGQFGACLVSASGLRKEFKERQADKEGAGTGTRKERKAQRKRKVAVRPRDSAPQKLFLGPKKYVLYEFHTKYLYLTPYNMYTKISMYNTFSTRVTTRVINLVLSVHASGY